MPAGVAGTVTQATATAVRFALPMFPLPPLTVQSCAGFVGWVLTVTR